MPGAEELGQAFDGGTLQRVPPNANQAVQIARLNSVIDRLNNLLKTQTFSDGANKRFINGHAPGRWPGGDFGMAISKPGDDVLTVDFADLLFAWDYATGTQYWYDPTTGDNYMQAGILPDGTGAIAMAKEGIDVDDAFN